MDYQKAKTTIDNSMRVIRNLPKKATADQRLVKDHTVARESYVNRCLNHLEKIMKFAPSGNFSNPKAPSYSPPRTRLEKYAVSMVDEACKTYLLLSNFSPRTGERLHWQPGKEYSLDAIIASYESEEDGDWEDLLSEDGVMETSAPDLYAGGLGYRHVNWDAEYLMAVDGSERHHNPYWNPKEATVKPVKHFTKEEIEALNCPNW